MTDVIIVGAGHAGLAASVCLQKYGIEHCVFKTLCCFLHIALHKSYMPAKLRNHNTCTSLWL
ncbi:MAG: FAD-dependent monooxygenase, partial [Pseudomonadota bacterium]|nr:FAD-dependent monooxygenase [Pseudomonadota bacterium]